MSGKTLIKANVDGFEFEIEMENDLGHEVNLDLGGIRLYVLDDRAGMIKG